MQKTSLILAILAAITANSTAQAGGAPNYYRCSGKDTQLSLFIGTDSEVGTGMSGPTELRFKFGKNNQAFIRDQIVVTSNLMGDIYQVELPFQAGNTQIKHASVIIPKVVVDNIITNNYLPSKNKFKTQLIITREVVESEQEFSGVVNPSSYIGLSCSSQMIF